MYQLNVGHGVVRHGPLRVWAERGLINIEDGRDNSYRTVAVRDFLDRVRAINEMLGKTTDKGIEALHATREYYQRLVERYVDVCRKAQEQGSPDDPSARRAAQRARARSIAVPRSYSLKM